MSKGFNISLNNKNIPTFEQEDELYAGSSINLFFNLPNGKTITETFKTGQDVEWAKNVLAQKIGLEAKNLKLVFNNNDMIDFLSLSDIVGLKNDSIIEVKIINSGKEEEKI